MRERLVALAMSPGPVRRALNATVGGFLITMMREPMASWFAMAGRRGIKVPSARAGRAPWQEQDLAVPAALLTTPGIAIDDHACHQAAVERPLRRFWTINEPWEDWTNRAWWPIFLRVLPRYMAGKQAVEKSAASVSRRQAPVTDSTTVTDLVRVEAERLGFSTIGLAAYDPRWTTAPEAIDNPSGTVIICLFEEDYDAEQLAPSAAHERKAMLQFGEQMVCTARLAGFIRDLGYEAVPHDPDGPFLYIPYAVAAGMGQLGLNGQLLTPVAGARCTITAISTQAPLVHGTPVDYGITGICDSCQACVRRCPVGAIPLRRDRHRGVTKAKIKTERCLPVVAQTDGCAICSKVCPIQRYGLANVLEHYRETGQIKGRETDDLEGFRWPLDARYYGAGAKPRIDSERLLHPMEQSSCPTPKTTK